MAGPYSTPSGPHQGPGRLGEWKAPGLLLVSGLHHLTELARGLASCSLAVMGLRGPCPVIGPAAIDHRHSSKGPALSANTPPGLLLATVSQVSPCTLMPGQRCVRLHKGSSLLASPAPPSGGAFVVDDLLTIIGQHERAGLLGRRSASLCQTYGARGNAAPFSLPTAVAAAA